LQRSRYSVSQEEMRPYSQLPHVLTGLFEVAARLFAVRITEKQDAPVWIPMCASSRYRADGHSIGSFYLDAYASIQQAQWRLMDECVGRKRLASGSALPVAYLVCNFLPRMQVVRHS